jgi:hypothetical protein
MQDVRSNIVTTKPNINLNSKVKKYQIMKGIERTINKLFLVETIDFGSCFGYEILPKKVRKRLCFLHQFRQIPLTQTERHKNLWEWLLYQLHQFRLNKLHLTIFDNQSFKLCCLGLPAQRFNCTDGVNFG